MRRINAAIIGIGHLGSRHLKVYREGLSEKVNLVGICDHHLERARKFAEHYKVKLLKDYQDLVNQVEAVNICVPTSSHFEIAKFFLERDVHTFIEKPITLNLREADILIKLARKKDLKLQVG